MPSNQTAAAATARAQQLTQRAPQQEHPVQEPKTGHRSEDHSDGRLSQHEIPTAGLHPHHRRALADIEAIHVLLEKCLPEAGMKEDRKRHLFETYFARLDAVLRYSFGQAAWCTRDIRASLFMKAFGDRFRNTYFETFKEECDKTLTFGAYETLRERQPTNLCEVDSKKRFQIDNPDLARYEVGEYLKHCLASAKEKIAELDKTSYEELHFYNPASKNQAVKAHFILAALRIVAEFPRHSFYEKTPRAERKELLECLQKTQTARYHQLMPRIFEGDPHEGTACVTLFRRMCWLETQSHSYDTELTKVSPRQNEVTNCLLEYGPRDNPRAFFKQAKEALPDLTDKYALEPAYEGRHSALRREVLSSSYRPPRLER